MAPRALIRGDGDGKGIAKPCEELQDHVFQHGDAKLAHHRLPQALALLIDRFLLPFVGIEGLERAHALHAVQTIAVILGVRLHLRFAALAHQEVKQHRATQHAEAACQTCPCGRAVKQKQRGNDQNRIDYGRYGGGQIDRVVFVEVFHLAGDRRGNIARAFPPGIGGAKSKEFAQKPIAQRGFDPQATLFRSQHFFPRKRIAQGDTYADGRKHLPQLGEEEDACLALQHTHHKGYAQRDHRTQQRQNELQKTGHGDFAAVPSGEGGQIAVDEHTSVLPLKRERGWPTTGQPPQGRIANYAASSGCSPAAISSTASMHSRLGNIAMPGTTMKRSLTTASMSILFAVRS